MFYLIEFKYRFFYTCFILFCLVSLSYIYRQNFLLLISYSVIECNEHIYFFYTHPLELFSIYIYMFYIISFFFLIPYLGLQILDYLKSGLYIFEYQNLKIYFFYSFLFFLIFNNFSIFYLFPQIWFFFEHISSLFTLFNFIETFYELKFDEYFFFIFKNLFFLNSCCFLLVLFYFSLQFFTVEMLLKYKILFLFFNIYFLIIIFSIDIINLFILLVCLFTVFEILLCIQIFYFKCSEYIYIT
jgi:Sec-independent protein secretion pathway component TatC